jgi:hypothetical protein
MSRGGAKPGERRGGRQRGTPNKATVQKQLIAAQIAERAAADARWTGRQLAKEVLEDFMHGFREIAERYRPTPPEAKQQNPHADEVKFNRFAGLAIECASKLAPYQSPTFKAIEIATTRQTRPVTDDCEPVKYVTVAEIRAELAARGLPPLKDILEVEDDNRQIRVDDAARHPIDEEICDGGDPEDVTARLRKRGNGSAPS